MFSSHVKGPQQGSLLFLYDVVGPCTCGPSMYDILYPKVIIVLCI